MTCPHCQQGTPLQHGIHMGEWWMERCTRELSLVPMSDKPEVREKWHRPDVRTYLPFVVGGAS